MRIPSDVSAEPLSDGNLGERLAAGRTSIIYAWGRNEIVKVFRGGWSKDAAEHEALIARAVYNAGLPVPAVGDIVEVGRLPGLVYERVYGVSMLTEIGRSPWRLYQFAHLAARLHHQMHSLAVPTFPQLVERLAERIRNVEGLNPRQREKLLVHLSHLQIGNRLCHGDFHPGNIILAERGPIVIDWADACQGNPVADVARTGFLMRSVWCIPKLSKCPLALAASVFFKAYLGESRKLAPVDQSELKSWAPILAAARMSEEVPGELEWLRKTVAQGLG